MSTEHEKQMTHMLPWFNRLATVTALAATVIAVATLALALVGGRMGYRAVFMTTGSMRPAIAPGDLVILRPVDPHSIQLGDVITFQAPVGSHELVTHRVVAVSSSPVGVSFRTKGDANAVPDIWIVHYQDLGWTEVGRVPGFGAATALLGTSAGRLGVVLAVFLLTLGLVLPQDSPRRSDAPGEATAA
jgi:signal peptidase